MSNRWNSPLLGECWNGYTVESCALFLDIVSYYSTQGRTAATEGNETPTCEFPITTWTLTWEGHSNAVKQMR